MRRLFCFILGLGGPLSGERRAQGIGIAKAAFLAMEVEEPALSLMRKLKQLFDPNGILNPGKIFP